MAEIFRKTALDRLSSPEELDVLLEVTTPKGWLALAGLAAIVTAGLVWSVVGSIPTRVSGTGILVRKGGLVPVSALAAGQLQELLVTAGQPVEKGQAIARLSLPDLLAELRGARAALAALEAEHRQLAELGTVDARLQAESLAKQRDLARGEIAAGRQRHAAYTRKLAIQTKLLGDGLVTEQELQATRDGVAGAEGEVTRAEGALADLSVKEAELSQRVLREGAERLKRIADAARRVQETERRVERDSTVSSPSDGRVIEVRAAVGSVVGPGTPVVLLELTGACLEGILYVPGADGKRIQAGMSVEVSPSTVKREEYGSLRATVTSVSPFPSTQRAMLANLGNEELVGSFFRSAESPIEVRVDVTPDPKTPSGLSWTSPKGPPAVIEPGTLCAASISVRERRPISFVLPVLRERAGL